MVTEYCFARKPVDLYLEITFLVFLVILVVLVYNVNCMFFTSFLPEASHSGVTFNALASATIYVVPLCLPLSILSYLKTPKPQNPALVMFKG
ncbi:hypothetical protein PN36_21930 [Candidatus Thiomargarita nelsonii]|uniref:Uncharacterized protein n=1 Tax=Candidatus Thiomargarita nelsonii TaxID=1003181 RepID=A0A0A6PH21_9GAMM|nr:hypothetical protein PN36_21930 [Candidatus Thiomargarita nelsonii]